MTFEHKNNFETNKKTTIMKDSTSTEVITENSLINKIENQKNYVVQRQPQKKKTYCIIAYLVLLSVTLTIGILTMKYSLFDLFMEEKLRMTPGYPPFEWWRLPKPEILQRTFIFTVTNPNAFLNGTDKKIKIKEFGPIIYREWLEHTDVEFHSNSTMSYTVRRHLEFLPDRNEPGILNRTIIVPNIVFLGMTSVLESYNMEFLSSVFDSIIEEDNVFINTTVYNYLWNLTTPSLLWIRKHLPFVAVSDNGGALHNVYKDFTDRVNVKIGPENGAEKFFRINTYNGRPYVPGFMPEFGDCNASLENSTEGANYPGNLDKNSVIYYWRKTVCRPIPLIFEKEVHKESMKAYKFIAEPSMYDRFENLTADCYKGNPRHPLPSGLTDVSKCYDGVSVVISMPHFYGRTGFWNDQYEGFHPNWEEHSSFAIIEPKTGVPFEQCARSQSNMLIPKLNNVPKSLQKLSGMIVPTVWLEYHQKNLTSEIISLLYFTIKVLPILEYILPTAFTLLSALFIILIIKNFIKNNK